MWLTVLIVLLAVVAVIFTWGVLHLRHSQRRALEEIARVRPEDIPALAQECIERFRQHFDERLDLADYQGSAVTFGARLDQPETLKQQFARDDFYWYFVLPTGAFLGELLRTQLGGSWETTADGAPQLKLPVNGDEVTTFPFDKIIKHVTIGDPGDMYAFLQSALHLDEAVARSGTAEGDDST